MAGLSVGNNIIQLKQMVGQAFVATLPDASTSHWLCAVAALHFCSSAVFVWLQLDTAVHSPF